jgi:hypothetical protein
VKSNDDLRRTRKALLAELSSLVKTAKSLHELTRGNNTLEADDINDFLDAMILKAFKIVTRAVRFSDVLEEFLKSYQQSRMQTSPMAGSILVPPTPPADVLLFEHRIPASNAGSRRTSEHSSSTDGANQHTMMDDQTMQYASKRSSTILQSRPHSFQSRSRSTRGNRISMSHRISTTSPLPLDSRLHLVSEQLNASHDAFLSYLSSFIGRLHHQSQKSADLALTVRQSILAGKALVSVIDAVSSQDTQSQYLLLEARETMFESINQLLQVARDCLRYTGSEEEDIILPYENDSLRDAATDCVVAAGECVAKTKFAIERIGDFELDLPNEGLGIDVTAFGSSSTVEVNVGDAGGQTPAEFGAQQEDHTPSFTREVARTNAAGEPHGLPLTSRSEAVPQQRTHSNTFTSSSTLELLPPLPNLASPIILQTEGSLSPSSERGDFQQSFRSASTAISTTTSNSNRISSVRDSEMSIVSAPSTRATTPDHNPSHQSSHSSLGMLDSQATLVEDLEETESKMMEKTFAHELLLNKEGQITGGTLPALVERLTTHDSTPDAMFVSTFYLTFRLFVAPARLAGALIERFDYVSESPHIAAPVRLRVYNVFKGWLESHWRESTDREALPIIESFGKEKLSAAVPAAGKRLLELTARVAANDGTLVPRLVSSMGKTNTSITQYIPADTPLPPPVLSKSNNGALKAWKMGGLMPTMLEFDPLELARQLTIKEMNIFCSIMPEELLASEWMKKSGSSAVNVRAMSTLSTDLSNLVADTILQHEDAKKRAAYIKHWIKIAQRCLELNNYDSLMAIICSLNSSTITRLKKTWDIVSQKRKDMLKSLQSIVEPTKNHAVLRQKVANHVPPCLPFVGTYLTDLTFVDIGNPATKQLPGADGMSVINFDKHARTAKIIGELQRFQIPYRLTEVPELQEWLQAQIVRVKSSVDQNNVQQYYRKSLLLEPRSGILKPSPVEAQGGFAPNSSKEKFDIFAWAHSKDKSTSSATTSAV